MTEPLVASRAGFRVMGVLLRFTEGSQNPTAAWLQFIAREREVRPLSTDGAFYGVDYYPGDDGVYEYIAGMAVDGDVALIPDGLVLREIPAAHWAEFETTADTIGKTYEAIWEWLPSAKFEADLRLPNVERYQPVTPDGDERPIAIRIPIRGKVAC